MTAAQDSTLTTGKKGQQGSYPLIRISDTLGTLAGVKGRRENGPLPRIIETLATLAGVKGQRENGLQSK